MADLDETHLWVTVRRPCLDGLELNQLLQMSSVREAWAVCTFTGTTRGQAKANIRYRLWAQNSWLLHSRVIVATEVYKLHPKC